MLRVIFIFFLGLGLLSFSFQSPKIFAKYQRFNENKPLSSYIFLYKNGTFFTQLAGGCDGTVETRGKWKINKDTLNFTEIEVRIFTDPWKKTEVDCQFLRKKQTLTSFSIVDNKMILNEDEFYKKVK